MSPGVAQEERRCRDEQDGCSRHDREPDGRDLPVRTEKDRQQAGVSEHARDHNAKQRDAIGDRYRPASSAHRNSARRDKCGRDHQSTGN